MALREIEELSASEKSGLLKLVASAKSIVSDIDEALARHGFSQLHVHGLVLTPDVDASLKNRTPDPAGVGIDDAGRHILSADFGVS